MIKKESSSTTKIWGFFVIAVDQLLLADMKSKYDLVKLSFQVNRVTMLREFHAANFLMFKIHCSRETCLKQTYPISVCKPIGPYFLIPFHLVVLPGRPAGQLSMNQNTGFSKEPHSPPVAWGTCWSTLHEYSAAVQWTTSPPSVRVRLQEEACTTRDPGQNTFLDSLPNNQEFIILCGSAKQWNIA